MVNKLTYEKVRNFIEDKGGELLSKEYVNSYTKLSVQCDKGHIWQPLFNNLISKKSWCPKCRFIDKPTGKQKFTLQYVQDFVKDKGWCLSDNYTRSEEKLEWKCFCGNIWNATFADVKRKNSWCRECAKEKRKNTVLKKYGVENVSQNKEIHKKQCVSMNDSFRLKHWKTGKDVVCRGSFEKLVVEYLNKNKIDFKWQIIFPMPDNRKYIIDLFLKDENKYVEIKGHFWGDSKQKWNWFHEEYPNSELWNMKKLQKMNILPKSYYYHKNKGDRI